MTHRDNEIYALNIAIAVLETRTPPMWNTAKVLRRLLAGIRAGEGKNEPKRRHMFRLWGRK